MLNEQYEQFKNEAKKLNDHYRELDSVMMGKNEIRKVLIAEDLFIFELFPDNNGFDFYPISKSQTMQEVIDIAVPLGKRDRFEGHDKNCNIRTYETRGKETPYFMDCDCGVETITG